MKELTLKNGLKTKISDEDFEYLNKFKWHAAPCLGKNKEKFYYATTNVNGRHRKLHTLLFKNIEMVDHKDGDRLNNQRDNLRPCNCSDNGKNRDGYGKSKYKGVYPKRKRFQAQISIHDKKHHLGSYKTEIEAALAFNKAAIATGNLFYRLNVIE